MTMRFAGSSYCLDLHVFEKEEEAEVGCCKCKTGKMIYPRHQKVTMLACDNQKITEEWLNRILWAMEERPYKEG